MAVISLVALVILLMGWVGYPIITSLLATWRPEPGGGPDAATPEVSVVIATRDDPVVVARRVANIQETKYLCEHLVIIVAVDARSAWPSEEYRMAMHGSAAVVDGDAPGGKASTLNAGVRAASGELVVFADSRQIFAPDTIPLLVQYLGDSRFGAVSGTLALVPEHYGGTVLGLWWQFELFLRRSEAAIHSLVGVTGAVYCIRRSLWTSLPWNLICDDLFVPLHLAMNGHRVGHCEAAQAFDPRRLNRTEEFRRRVRTLTGILQLCAWRPAVLLPWRNPVWVQFACHKLLRVATPYLVLLVAIGLIPWLVRTSGTWLAGTIAVLVMVTLVLAITRPSMARKLGSQLIWAARLHAAPVKASLNALRGRWDVW
ncbi:MAG: glycosyltransferase [Gemmatimonadales bacterium]|nr:glycosyltransferase [Gemmatimonadales bacterium]